MIITHHSWGLGRARILSALKRMLNRMTTPLGLFSAEEQDRLRPLKNDVTRAHRNSEYVFHNTPFSLSQFAESGVSIIETVVDPQAEAPRLFHRCQARDKSNDPAFQARRREILVTESTYFPRDQPWILRNLTTKEFVRSEAVVIKPEYCKCAEAEDRVVGRVVGFGEVVMYRTCWSSYSSDVLLNDTTFISREVWAGHRFDITTLARHEAEVDSAGWSDVSEEVSKEIAAIWSYEFGSDMR